MEIEICLVLIGIGILIAIMWGIYKITDELGIISTYLMRIRNEIKEIKEIKNTEAVDARVTRRDINDDYGFRNPLLRSETGYRVNRRGQYVPNKPNVEEDEDV